MADCISSSWMRWDPHLHAPGTAQNDQFKGDWESYLNSIENAAPPVVALGITDYCSVNTYEKFIAFRNKGRARGVTFIFPNIEFRLLPFTRRAQPLNLHILVSPEGDDHVGRCKEALAHLTVIYGEETVSCDRRGLVRLGGLHRQQTNNPTDDEDALFGTGVSQFKVDTSRFLEWYQQEQWLRRNSLLAVSGGNDGLAGLRRDSGFKQFHDELLRKTHFVFSGVSSDIMYFLGQGTQSISQVESLYGHLKACLHGSDAHCLGDTLQPQDRKYCWIKACPCFDGLRQTLFEPAERVHIGAEPPTRPDSDSVIESLAIANHRGWFDSDRLSFSPYLNSIVGEKGTGKTALTDLIAFATWSWEDHEGAFLHKAWKELRGARVTVTWASGRESVRVIGDDVDSVPSETRYLSQQFVERLCSGDIMAEQLLREVERVVFDHIPEPERMNCSDFRELRNKVTADIRAERQELEQAILQINQQIEGFQEAIRAVTEKQKLVEKYGADIKARRNDLSLLLEGEVGATVSRAEELRKQLSELNVTAASKNEQINALNTTKARVQRLEQKFAELHASLEEDLRKAGVSDRHWPAYKPVFAGDVETPIRETYDSVAAELQKLQGLDVQKPAGNSILGLQKLLESEEKRLALSETRKKQVRELRTKIERLEADVRRIESEIKDADHARAVLMPEAQSKRMGHYLRYFELLNKERKSLARLYEPLITQGTTSKQGPLEFEVATIVDTRTWSERGENMLDLRRGGTLSRHGALAALARDKIEEGWRSCDTEAIRGGIETLIAAISSEGLASKLRAGFAPRDIADWVFSVSHIQLQYSLKYDGVPLRFLSPGTRGILLLILYLSLDSNDDRPLLIDQPEENLDNASVYDVLVEYFRNAKKRRQILIISHNPNLVVNTDSEQVVVAFARRRDNDLPVITYKSGPLEVAPGPGSSIRTFICQILEGGERAFLKREERYDIPRPAVWA